MISANVDSSALSSYKAIKISHKNKLRSIKTPKSGTVPQEHRDTAFRVCFILKVAMLLQVNELYRLEPALCKSSLSIPRAKNINMGIADTSESCWVSKDLLALIKLNAATLKFIQPKSLVYRWGTELCSSGPALHTCQQTHEGSEWLPSNQPKTGASPEPELVKSRESKLIQQC